MSQDYIIDFHPKIPYDYDFVCNHFVWRCYEWIQGEKWDECERLHLVGDGDTIYDKKGNSVTFEDSDPKVQYYVADPSKMACDEKMKQSVLGYLKVRSISKVKEPIDLKRLRFVGVPLLFVSYEKKVGYDFVFDLLDDIFGEVIYKSLNLFEGSQARAVFAHLYSSIGLPTLIPKNASIEDMFHYYNVLHQFSEKYEEVASDNNFYNKKSFKKVLELKDKITKEEKDALVTQMNTQFQNKSKKDVDEIEGRLSELESDKEVKKFIDLYEKAAAFHEKADSNREKLEKMKEGPSRDKIQNILKRNEDEAARIEKEMEKLETKKTKEWEKLFNKYQDVGVTQQDELSLDFMKEKLEAAIQENTMLLFTEFLPELDLDEEDESIVEEEGSEETEEVAKDDDFSSESEDGYEVESDSEEEENGDEIVDWNSLDDKDDKSESEDEGLMSSEDEEALDEEDALNTTKKSFKVSDWEDEEDSEEDEDFQGEEEESESEVEED